jgi:DDE superfamily endonuclease
VTPKLAALHGAIQAELPGARTRRSPICGRWLGDAHALRASEGLMRKTLARLGLTLKKSRAMLPEQQRPDVAAAPAAWRRQQPTLRPGRLVFIDETWARTNMTRLYGRAPRGQRLVAALPHGHWKTSTFIGALREDGLVAPGVFEGAINGRSFLAYVPTSWLPQIQASSY